MHLYKSHHHDINNLTRFSRQANRGLIRCSFPELTESFYSMLFLPGVRENWRPANVCFKMSGRTCDGVGVEVPGLFRHVEDARDEGLGPGRQFTEKQSRRVRAQTWEGAGSGGRERFQPETKRSWVGFVPFIARLPVGYAQHRIHLHDSPPNYVCSNESLLWLRGRMSKHDGGWMHVALAHLR